MDVNEDFSFIKDSIRETPKEDPALVDFSANMREFVEILDMLHDNIQPMTLGITKGPTLHMYFSQHILSAINTLGNIEYCAIKWNFSDSFTLARKFRDDLFQCLFIINTISSYEEHCKDLTSKGNPNTSNTTSINEDIDSLSQYFDAYFSETSRRSKDNAIIGFLENSISGLEQNTKRIRKEFFDASKYREELLKDPIIKACFDSFFTKPWEDTDRVLNNYVHANGLRYITSNLNQYIFSGRDKLLSELSLVIKFATTMFLSIMILINPTCIMSSDYVDALEMDMIPEEGSQYWVAPGIQEFIDKYVVEISPDLKKYLQEENKYGMEI